MIERVRGIAISFLTVILLVAGCTPPGLRAFREGNALLDKGRAQEAVEQFKIVTSLFPTNALAWNALGVSYHMSGQASQADIAYQRALALERDLREPRYNLGCLALDQDKPEVARALFTTLALRGPPSADVLLRLASAQIRLKDLSGAEKSYSEVLRLDPKNAQALNGLGVVKAYRNRGQEAASLFTASLKENPAFAPALLNLAVTKHQSLRDRAAALGHYRDYLSSGANPAQQIALRRLIGDLEADLRPPAAVPAVTNLAAVPVKTNQLVATAAQPSEAKTNISPKIELAQVPPRTINQPDTSKAPPVSSTRTSAGQQNVAPKTNRPAPATPSPKVEVVHVPPEQVFTAADQMPEPRATTPAQAPTQSPTTALPSSTSGSTVTAAEPKPPRRGFLQSVNPLRLFDGGDKPSNASSKETPQLTAATKESGLPVASAKYRYSSPSPGKEGNSAEAKKAFSQGLQAQSKNKASEAILAYLRATQLDPAMFEAHFNLAIAYTQAGNVPSALKTYEEALALRPNHSEARYNFALLLRDSNYLADAVAELEKILVTNPNHASANLALANLYAQQLRQPARAKPYFQRVLEIDPKHPQAASIRYWLSVNP